MEWLGALIDHPATKIIAFVLGIVGTWVGVIAWRKRDPERRPVYRITSYSVVGRGTDRFPGLEMTYKGQPIREMHSTIIRFWNAGAIPIDKSDLDTINPLKFMVSQNDRILDAYVLRQNGASINPVVTISEDQRKVFLSFDYLNKAHGLVVVVLHTGASNDLIKVVGDIKGVERIQSAPPLRNEDFPRTTGVAIIVLGALLSVKLIEEGGVITQWLGIMIATLLSIIVMYSLLMWHDKRTRLVTRGPSGLD